jgi:heparan-alpha-glucosaminide N-acetyltransferase
MTASFRRLASIDAFRALTMFLMIFVNDLWSLKDMPAWLEHAKMAEDRMGLADAVFPAFLFIVGLSIPLAIKGRQSKGLSRESTLIHILTRSFALLVMGIFHVNLESYNRAQALIPKPWWQIGITIGFFLVWLDYSNFPNPLKWWKKKTFLQGVGVLLLVIMALLYKGGTPGNSGWMRPQWYGILGLIGWSYLLCAIVYLFSKDRLTVLCGALVFFLGFLVASKAGWLTFLDPVKPVIWFVSNGALPAITMAGVVVSVIYRKYLDEEKGRQGLLGLGILALVLLAAGFALRPFWGISKIRATPSWVLICTAISLACFICLAFLMDLRGYRNLFHYLRPAGTSTLTCYLLPYIHYAIFNLLGPAIRLPLALRTGGPGILKSLLYALLIIWITGVLEKRRIRLSI